MLELREKDRAALSPQQAHRIQALGTLADVVTFGPILDVIIQDEFTHDVIVGLPGKGALVFEAT